MSVKLLNRKNRGDNIPLSFGNAADSKIYFDGTNTYWEPQAVGTGKLMIALADSPPAPDADFHIWNGSAGTVDAVSSASLVIEDSANATINLLAPLNGEAGLWIGNSDSAVRGRLIYYGRSATLADSWQFQMVGAARLNYSVGAFAFQEATTISTSASTLTLDPTTDVVVANGKGLIVGHTAKVVVNDSIQAGTTTSQLQVLGNSWSGDESITIGGFHEVADRGAPSLLFLRSKHGTVGGNTAVQTDDFLGGIAWNGANGSNFHTIAASITAEVDTGTVGSTSMPGRLVFKTSPDGSESPGSSMIISSVGLITLLRSVDSAAVADQVSISRYEIGGGNTVLGISQETAVASDNDESKFSHKMQVRINGATYFIMLTAT